MTKTIACDTLQKTKGFYQRVKLVSLPVANNRTA